jgi:hypothetical protein
MMGLILRLVINMVDNRCIVSLYIEDEYIENIDIGEIVEDENFLYTIIPDYIKDLVDISIFVKDVNNEMIELWKTWQF